MDQLAKPAEIDLIAAKVGLADVDVSVAQDLVRVAERVEDSALAGAVASEEKRDRPEVDPDPTTDSLEVFDLDGCDQWSSVGAAFGFVRHGYIQ